MSILQRILAGLIGVMLLFGLAAANSHSNSNSVASAEPDSSSTPTTTPPVPTTVVDRASIDHVIDQAAAASKLLGSLHGKTVSELASEFAIAAGDLHPAATQLFPTPPVGR